MRICLLALLVLLLPSAARAATFELRDLAGCQLPIQPGAKAAANAPALTFENGNVVLNGKGLQHSIFWFPGANAELTLDVVGLYAGALAKSGAVLDTKHVTWETVDGSKAARLPVRMSKEQPVDGLMLMWASVSTGRYFLYVLTPSWSSAGKPAIEAARLGEMATEAAGLASCAGAGKVSEPLAVLDPLPAGYGFDVSDLPRLTYVRQDGRHVAVLWRTPASVLGRGTCSTPAEPLFDRFAAADARLTYRDDAEVDIDNLAGTQPGAVCDVQRPVRGMTEVEGGKARFRMLRCDEGQDGVVSVFELVAGDAGETIDVGAARCMAELPKAGAAPAPTPGVPEVEKRQWVPGK